MKKILKSLAVAAGALFVAASCNQDQIGTYFDAGERPDAGYFTTSSYAEEFEEGASGDRSFTLPLRRYKADGSYTIGLTVTPGENAAGIFEVPTSVTFADGEYTASITVTVPQVQNLNYEVAYKATIEVQMPEGFKTIISDSNYPAITISALLHAGWESIGEATITDDFMTTFFSVDNLTWQVPIEENQAIRGYYRLLNPYGEAYPYNDPGDYDESGEYYFYVHSEDPDAVWIPTTRMGFDWGYGEFYFSSMAGYHLNRDEPDKAEEYYGKRVDGVITFPKNSLLIAMMDYNDGALYQANSNGKFAIVLPGAVKYDYEVEVAYVETYTNDADGLDYAVAEVAGGADVEYIEVAMGADPEAVLEAMMSGAADVVKVDGNAGTAEFAVSEDGTYYFVAVSYAKGEAREVAAASFKYFADPDAANPLEKDYTFDDMNDLISKSDLFSKTWVLWGVDNDDEDGITDRQPFAYVNFSENEELDFEEDGEEYDMINVEGLGLGATADDTHVWEYYEGVLLNFYMHDNIGQWNGYYINYLPAAVGSTAFGFYDEMMVACVVDEGYMALCYSGFYNLGNNPEPNGLYWYAFPDAECTTPAGYLMRMKDIMFQDAEIFATMAASNAKVSKAKAASTFTSKDLQLLNNAMTFRSDYVQTNRGYMRSKIDALKASKRAAAAEAPAHMKGSAVTGLREVSADRTFKLTNDTPAAYLR